MKAYCKRSYLTQEQEYFSTQRYYLFVADLSELFLVFLNPIQRKITYIVRGSITVQLVSSLTELDSTKQ